MGCGNYVDMRPENVEDVCWEVGKNFYSRSAGFNLVVAGKGIFFIFRGSVVHRTPIYIEMVLYLDTVIQDATHV